MAQVVGLTALRKRPGAKGKEDGEVVVRPVYAWELLGGDENGDDEDGASWGARNPNAAMMAEWVGHLLALPTGTVPGQLGEGLVRLMNDITSGGQLAEVFQNARECFDVAANAAHHDHAMSVEQKAIYWQTE